MKGCLAKFCKGSGQKVDLQKSSIFFSKNTQEEDQKKIVESMRIPKVVDLGRYLGVSSIHGRLKKESFAGLIDKIQNKLSGWKDILVLAQSVLSAIPYYTMKTTLIPKGMIDSMEKMKRNFLWGSSNDGRKCHLINWDTVTSNK